MIQFLKNIFSSEPKPDLQELIDQGGVIVDVRSVGEFSGGHLSNSKNIPLDQLKSKLSTLDKDTPVITCCASGMRSASAKRLLKSNGFKQVVNGGGWQSLKKFER